MNKIVCSILLAAFFGILSCSENKGIPALQQNKISEIEGRLNLVEQKMNQLIDALEADESKKNAKLEGFGEKEIPTVKK